MVEAADAPRRSGARTVRVVARIVLTVVLAVLLVLLAVRKAPAIAAAFAPSPSATVAEGGRTTPTTVASTRTGTTSPAPTASASTSSSDASATDGGVTQSGGGSGTTVTVPKATHTPPAAQLRIDSLSAANVACAVPSQAPAAGSSAAPVVAISWSSSGAVQAWFGIDTSDAKSNPYAPVQPDGGISVDWPCPTASEQYTITVESASGATVSRSITVRNTGYTG